MKRLQLSDQMIPTTEVVRRLGITQLTVHNWRKGSATRTPLPTVSHRQGGARRIRFAETDLVNWLAINRPDLAARWQTLRGQHRWTAS